MKFPLFTHNLTLEESGNIQYISKQNYKKKQKFKIQSFFSRNSDTFLQQNIFGITILNI